MKRLIINADDFGLSPGVNRGIVDSFREGILTSTTMLVNLEHFDDAVRLAKENPDLPTGVHLSLLWGPPVSNPSLVRSLVDREGRFLNDLGSLARRYLLGRLSMKAVRAEFRLQISKFVDAGLEPTHVDTHKHIHCLDGILDSLITVAAEFGIDRVRLPHESGLSSAASPAEGQPLRARPSGRSATKVALIRHLTRRHRRALAARGMRTTDHFLGVAWQDRLNSETIPFIFGGVRDGLTELMCHPGYTDSPSSRYSRRPPDREAELHGLTSPETRAAAKAQRIELVSYRAL